MFGDTSTVADVRLLLAKQTNNDICDLYSSLGLDNLESTLINSLRYLMNTPRDISDGGDGSDVEAWSEGAADEERLTISRDNLAQETREDGQGETEAFETGSDSVHQIHDEECQCSCNHGVTADEGLNILQLPIQALLHIFSFLDAQDIATVGSTCRQCYSLCADQILWRDFLEKDKLLWQQVGHRSNPALYEAVNSDLTYKEIYMRCSPQFQRESSGFNLLKLPQLLWSFIPHKPPKVVMFGPGLESNTSTLVRKFLGGESDVFKVRGVFPAELQGVGTGFKISMNGKVDMRLITMYSGTRRDREGPSVSGSRAKRNRLLQAVQGSLHPGAEEGDETEDWIDYEPTSTIKELCRNVDAFIFVVDASNQIETTADAQPELFAFMNERWTSSKCPLLILSCVPDSSTNRVPCVTVAKQLDLHKLNRTWKMFDADLNNLSGLVEAITWLVGSTEGR